MERSYTCLRCGAAMEHILTDDIQLGRTGWFLGDLPNLLAGSLTVAVYRCRECGKLEFFSPEAAAIEPAFPQVTCPSCGHTHDFDYHRCPFCKHSYD